MFFYGYNRKMDKQKLDIISTQYFLEDKSLREIGKFFGISKQAIHAFILRNKGAFKEKGINLLPAIDQAPFTLTKKIKLKRQALGLSQLDIAKELGTTNQYISQMELSEAGNLAKKTEYNTLLNQYQNNIK
jgi:predicted DNA-binding protein YlxM (UPF0122 family)